MTPRPPAAPDVLLLRRLRPRLRQELVVEAVEIETAHHGRLAHQPNAALLHLRRGGVLLQDLVAELAEIGRASCRERV